MVHHLVSHNGALSRCAKLNSKGNHTKKQEADGLWKRVGSNIDVNVNRSHSGDDAVSERPKPIDSSARRPRRQEKTQHFIHFMR